MQLPWQPVVFLNKVFQQVVDDCHRHVTATFKLIKKVIIIRHTKHWVINLLSFIKSIVYSNIGYFPDYTHFGKVSKKKWKIPKRA